MIMPPWPSSGELWGQCFMPEQVEVSFLMPNGIFLVLIVDRESTLQCIKDVCWKEAQLYPGYNLLHEASNYIFVGVTQNGEKEKFYDELRRLCDLRLFQPILKFIEQAGNRNEKILNAKIGLMIGISSDDTNNLKKDLEEQVFKENITEFCKNIVVERNSLKVEDLALYYFPPDIFPNSQIPVHVSESLKRDNFKFKLTVWLSVETNDRCKFTFHTKYDLIISQVVIESLRKKLRSENDPACKHEAIIQARAANCVVKVCGYNEYLLGDYPLCQYRYIRQCLMSGKIPELMLVDRSGFLNHIRKNLISCPPSNHKVVTSVSRASKDIRNVPLWSVNDKLKVKINAVSNLGSKENTDIFVKVGLHQAEELLCQSVCTREVCWSEGRWDEWLELGVRVSDVPRSAHLSFALCCSEGKKKKKKNEESAVLQSKLCLFDFNAVFIGSRRNFNQEEFNKKNNSNNNNNKNNNNNNINITSTTSTTTTTTTTTNNKHKTTYLNNVFDPITNDEVTIKNINVNINEDKSELKVKSEINDNKDKKEHDDNTENKVNDIRKGETEMKLLMWEPHPVMDDLLNPLDSSEISKRRDSTSISISLERMVGDDEVLTFPSDQEVIKHSQTLSQNTPFNFSKENTNRIEQIKEKDPLSELTEQDKLFLWKMREFVVKKAYKILPKLVQSVKWHKKDDVAVLHELLTRCPIVNTVTSLELLHSCHLDLHTRSFAVKCLDERLSTYHLSHYLLQLVHALEFEQYYDNSLLRFLLKRALNNQKLGQAFFWYLRSFMQHSRRGAYYGVIMEAYLRHCGHLESLCRQVEAVDKLNKLSEDIKMEKDENQLKSLQTLLQRDDCVDALNNIISPLNPNIPLNTLEVSSCDVKSSKKRPILLTWKSTSTQEPLSPSFQVIFKTGDDLRQDMLTLQVFELMNGIWEMEGLDVRLIPYRCLATAPNAGMIEVVSDAKTVMQVMGKDFNSKELHNWIRKHNLPSKVESERCLYQHAVDTFMRSCAGYCVATFVLGIGDRHPSNIMVTKSGQVFHIDFGHFLNHRKKKFGINRERVPFVLTEDFMRVIAKGQDNPEKSVEFANFMQLCGKAYLYLRRHSNLIISLFSMMLSSGMPELESLDDVEYLRKTLMVESRHEKEALAYFQDRFTEAYKGAWTTKVDWFFHWVKHNT